VSSERVSQPGAFVDGPLGVQLAGEAGATDQVYIHAAMAQGVGQGLLRVLPRADNDMVHGEHMHLSVDRIVQPFVVDL
jgi:hypothetical protein